MLKNANNNPFSLTAKSDTDNYYINRGDGDIDWFKDVNKTNRNNQKGHQFLQSSLSKDKIWLWLALLIIGLVILLGRVFYLQLFEGENFRAVAEGNRVRIRDVKSTRGIIYDRDQNILVKNIPNFSLAVVPVDLPRDEEKINEIISHLAAVAQKPEEEIRQVIKQQPFYSYQPIIIKQNLNFEQAALTKIESYNYPGVILKINSTRQYINTPEIPSLSHILGYSGKINPDDLERYLDLGYSIDDYVGKIGLELNYEEILKGKNGKEYVEVNAFGETKNILDHQLPQPGKNLVLTIDSELQKIAEQSLKNILSSYGKKKGSVIILDPNSGEILALVTWPAFDSNLFATGISFEDFSDLINNLDQPLFNRSISGEYPSGSTFKLIVASAALQEDLITPNTSFHSVGGIGIKSWFFPDWKAGGHGWTNVIKAISESVNTFFYIIGGGHNDFDGLGVKKIKKYAEMFGLNKQLGIDLPNEATGFLPDIEWKQRVKQEQWYIGDTYHLAIGQGDILVTPLQVAAWTSVFANGGKLYQPHLVKEINDVDSSVIIQPKILNQGFIDPTNISIVNRGLRQAVLTGSAKGLYGLPVAVAAKTGTAQWSSKNYPHSWLTAFAPYKKPEIVVTVLIEEGGEGSSTSVPVARQILEWWAINR